MLFTSVITTVSHCLGYLICGLGNLAIAATIGPIQGISNLVLSVILGYLIGVSGVAWSTGICMLVFSLGLIGTDTFRRLKLLQKEYDSSISTRNL